MNPKYQLHLIYHQLLPLDSKHLRELMNLPVIQMMNHFLVNKNQQRDNILNLKQSVYNSNQLSGDICEMCKENISSEVHHLQHQKNADVNGFLEKDHKIKNLLILIRNMLKV